MSQSTPNPEALPYTKIIRSRVVPYPTTVVSTPRLGGMTFEGLAAFGYELGLLKRVRRSGWWHAGVRDPESVGEHSLRAAQLAALLAAEEGASPERAAFLALWHDTQETRTGDLPLTAVDYLRKPEPRAITADQTDGLPDRKSTRLNS